MATFFLLKKGPNSAFSCFDDTSLPRHLVKSKQDGSSKNYVTLSDNYLNIFKLTRANIDHHGSLKSR